ncbi:DUF211 domain-containing protein [Haloprofundus salilacus]|uniref:DUF211 domain-containing protein n=1 Tax=Haloprofundus salilacus TaxID=2876190 RepID=UPI001CCD35A6|nr:DUF211 domain-containing protein [Haloprofundus salilacus]
MAPIRRVVLDLLKPYEPPTDQLASELAGLDGIDGVNAKLVETDQEVQNLKLTVEGGHIDYERLESTIYDLGGSIHSIDEVAAGEYIVEESETPQD